MTPKFFMLVGLPASGKSTYAEELANQYNANIHASDSIREELSGDINNQNINDLVFKTLHSRVKEDLTNGKSCIYDATNINYKRRMAFLNELNKIPCINILTKCDYISRNEIVQKIAKIEKEFQNKTLAFSSKNRIYVDGVLNHLASLIG
jgi:predicted kinase